MVLFLEEERLVSIVELLAPILQFSLVNMDARRISQLKVSLGTQRLTLLARTSRTRAVSGPGGFDFRPWTMPEPLIFATASHEMSRRAQRCEQMAGLVIPTKPWWGTHIECKW